MSCHTLPPSALSELATMTSWRSPHPAPLISWGGRPRYRPRSSARRGSDCSWWIAVWRYLQPILSATAWWEEPIGSGWVPGGGGWPAGWRIGWPQVRQMVSVSDGGGAGPIPRLGCSAPLADRPYRPRPSVIGRSARPLWSRGSWRGGPVSWTPDAPAHQVKLWRWCDRSAGHAPGPAWAGRGGSCGPGSCARGCLPLPSGRPWRTRRSPSLWAGDGVPAARDTEVGSESFAGEREREGASLKS